MITTSKIKINTLSAIVSSFSVNYPSRAIAKLIKIITVITNTFSSIFSPLNEYAYMGCIMVLTIE